MSMDSDLLAELQRRPTRCFCIFELDIGGTTRRYAPTWVASEDGIYKGKVLSAGSIARSVSDSGFSLPRDSATISIIDEDRELESYIFAASIKAITGTAARIKIASTAIASSKWFTLFSGIIEDFSFPGIGQWSFTLRRNDYPLLGEVKIPYIQAYDWPNAPDASIGLPAQVVYGAHDSAGTGATGMVPTIYVDNSGFRYVISLGQINSLDAVYVDGVESASSNWALVNVVVNGRCWSLVDFTSDQGDAVVTVDCTGISSGEANPATQLEHFLTNFVFGDWPSSPGFLQTCPSYLDPADFDIDEAFFDEVETYFTDKQTASGGRVITSETTGLAVLEEWCAQHQVHAFWTYGGKIAIRADDHTVTDIYTVDAFYRQELSPEPEFLEVTYNARDLVSEVRTQYLYDHAASGFERQLTVVNPDAAVSSPVTLAMNWRESAI